MASYRDDPASDYRIGRADPLTGMRVAFNYIDIRLWTGGYQYLLNLIRVLLRYEQSRITPVLFVGTDVPESDLTPFTSLSGLQVEQSSKFNTGAKGGRLLQGLITGIDHSACRIFTKAGIQVVFEIATFHGWRFPMPAVAWMADFQHRTLPHMFSRTAWWKRELGLRMQILSGRTVMLSSESALRDYRRLYPGAANDVAMIPFAIMTGTDIGLIDAQAVRGHYALPERFFYLPNQFWRHKNHHVVIEAIALLRERSVSAVVVVTGNPVDLRVPGLYAELLQRVDRLGLKDQFRFLGLVRHPHVTSLMAGCMAVINPSLFEGWSTTVEEGKAIGARLILSDIPVHREQAPQAQFFDPQSPIALAALLEEVAAKADAGLTHAAMKIAKQTYEAQVRLYGQRLADLFEQVQSRHIRCRGPESP